MLSYFFWLEPESSSRGRIRIWIQMENFVDLYPVPDPHEMRIKNTDKHKDHYFLGEGGLKALLTGTPRYLMILLVDAGLSLR